MKYLVFALMLAGCATAPVDDAPREYRDRTVPIASKALFDVDRFMGDWHRIAGFTTDDCRTQMLTFARGTDGVIGMGSRCLIAGGAIVQSEGWGHVTGPGRLEVRFFEPTVISGEYWVLWVDESYRTAVIGTPSGEFGWIFNRNPQISADRLHAAREILDFNGYDVSQLIEVVQ